MGETGISPPLYSGSKNEPKLMKFDTEAGIMAEWHRRSLCSLNQKRNDTWYNCFMKMMNSLNGLAAAIVVTFLLLGLGVAPLGLGLAFSPWWYLAFIITVPISCLGIFAIWSGMFD